MCSIKCIHQMIGERSGVVNEILFRRSSIFFTYKYFIFIFETFHWSSIHHRTIVYAYLLFLFHPSRLGPHSGYMSAYRMRSTSQLCTHLGMFRIPAMYASRLCLYPGYVRIPVMSASRLCPLFKPMYPSCT